MGHKLKRLCGYLKNLLLFICLCPAAAVLRRTRPAYRGLWLVSERGFDARDNGYWFFRYLRTAHPEINACYVISPESPDYEKIARLGSTVRQGSLRHYLMYLSADRLISSHLQPAAPDLMIWYHLRQLGLRPRGKQAFLQHGIIMAEMKWMRYPTLKVDFFACGAKPEYDYISGEFGFPAGVVRYTGLCRYDNLLRAGKTKNMILVMPTWRGSGYPAGDAFRGTAFFRAYQSLLQNARLLRLLEEQDLTLVFYPHIELQPELGQFSSPSERVILAGWKDYDVQTLLMECRLLITDYSSVFFDVAYMEKPVVYYQFDVEEFRKYHYQEGYFSYEGHGFGPVLRTEEETVEAILACAGNGFRMAPEYRARLDAFFPVRDENNCGRTFEILSRMGEKA